MYELIRLKAVKLMSLVVGFGIAIFASAAWSADAPIVLRITVDHGPAIPRAASVVNFGKLVDKMSNGRIKTEIFWSGSLGGAQRSAVDTVRAGGAEIALISTSNFSALNRTWSPFDLPFLFSGPASLYKYMDSPEFAKLKEETERKDGLHLVFSEYDGWRHFVSVKRPIHTPDEMGGLKIRTTGSPVETAYATAFGAKPTAVDWGETYLALKSGLVDGYFMAYTAIVAFKHDDAVKYGTTLNVVPIIDPMFMSERFYQSLPKDLQQIVDRAGREVELESRKNDEAVIALAVAHLNKAGFVIYEPSGPEKARWVAKVAPVYSRFESLFPAGMVARIRDTQ